MKTHHEKELNNFVPHAAFGRLFLSVFRFSNYTFPGGSGEKCNFSPTIEILCMFSSDPLSPWRICTWPKHG
nr:MAG TPA: hypothetical protein [Caudoviricetes sp.]